MDVNALQSQNVPLNVVAATFFVKQHSVLDALASVPLCLIGEALIYWFKVLK